MRGVLIPINNLWSKTNTSLLGRCSRKYHYSIAFSVRALNTQFFFARVNHLSNHQRRKNKIFEENKKQEKFRTGQKTVFAIENSSRRVIISLLIRIVKYYYQRKD